MVDFRFHTGATVTAPDGEAFGTIEHVDNAAIFVNHDSRIVEVDWSMVDGKRSTPGELVLRASLEPAKTTVPVYAEELVARVTESDRGSVRIHKSVEPVNISESMEFGTDVVDIERIPGDTMFDEMPQSRQEGDTLVIPVVEEVLVLTKRYREIEQVRITVHRETRTKPIEETLRRESVHIDMVDAEGNLLDS